MTIWMTIAVLLGFAAVVAPAEFNSGLTLLDLATRAVPTWLKIWWLKLFYGIWYRVTMLKLKFTLWRMKQ